MNGKQIETSYIILYAKIQELYNSNQYKELIEVINVNSNIDFFNQKKEEYNLLAEMISVSYLELGILHEALSIINEYIHYLTGKGMKNSEWMNELTNLFLIKMEVYGRSNSPLKQFKTTIDYINHGGNDTLILDWKRDTEEKLYMKYVSIMKYFNYFIILLMFISILGLYYFEKSILNNIITTGVIWILINYLFRNRIKIIFIKIFNILYGRNMKYST